MNKSVRIFCLVIFMVSALIITGYADDETAIDLFKVWLVNGGNSLFGFEFTPLKDIDVTALGTFGSYGISDPHRVGIFDSARNLLWSDFVSSDDPADGYFRYKTIAPYALQEGSQYCIVTTTGMDWASNPYYSSTYYTLNPLITFNRGLYSSSGDFGYPTINCGAFPFWGPNFKFQVHAIPEPSSMLLFGFGAGLLKLLRKKKTRRL